MMVTLRNSRPGVAGRADITQRDTRVRQAKIADWSRCVTGMARGRTPMCRTVATGAFPRRFTWENLGQTRTYPRTIVTGRDRVTGRESLQVQALCYRE